MTEHDEHAYAWGNEYPDEVGPESGHDPSGHAEITASSPYALQTEQEHYPPAADGLAAEVHQFMPAAAPTAVPGGSGAPAEQHVVAPPATAEASGASTPAGPVSPTPADVLRSFSQNTAAAPTPAPEQVSAPANNPEQSKPVPEQLADVQVKMAKEGQISSDELFNDAETYLSNDADETNKILNMPLD